MVTEAIISPFHYSDSPSYEYPNLDKPEGKNKCQQTNKFQVIKKSNSKSTIKIQKSFGMRS